MCQFNVVSADSHINEPPDLFEKRLPKHLRDIGPKLVKTERGDAWFLYPDAPPRLVSTSAVAGRKKEEYLTSPVTYDNMRPGSFDPVERIKDLDIDGIDADVLFPGIMRGLGSLPTGELRIESARAYNDWMHEFCSYNPQRLIGLPLLPPLDDFDAALEELQRVKKLGFRSAWLGQRAGGIPLHHPDVEGFWATAEQLDIPINLHIGTSAMANPLSLAEGARQSEYAQLPGSGGVAVAVAPMSIAGDFAAIVLSGLFDRHPGLKIVIAEGSIGWVPFFIQRLDHVVETRRGDLKFPISDWPSTIIRNSHIYYTFQEDKAGVRLRDMLGVDKIMWASDYPHTDTTFPESRKVIEDHFGSLPADERHLMVAENAARLYGLIDARN